MGNAGRCRGRGGDAVTPLFDGIDLAPDAAFLLWFAVGMAAIGLVIGAYMVGMWEWRRGIGMRAQRRHARFEKRVTRVTRRRR